MELENLMKKVYQSFGFDPEACVVRSNLDKFEAKFNVPSFAGQIFYLDINNKIATGFSMGVAPNFRNKGIGSQLIKALEEFCKKAGMDYFIINHNTNTRRCWERKFGYKLMTEEERDEFYIKHMYNFNENTVYKRLI